MKGLLLKDLYMMKTYCKMYLLIAIVFTGMTFVNDSNLFFVFYPCLLCGMIPVNLLGYDERSRWVQYSAALPYTRAQIVSAKYLIGLFSQLAVLIVTAVSQAVRMSINGNFVLREYAVLMLMMLIVATLTSSITMPFIFKLGVEKGRMAYYLMIGFVCAASAVATNLFGGRLQVDIKFDMYMVILALVGVAVYALSWYLSIVFYKKREL